jgi:glycosyltransferase involved in cell wall biosynthesis
MIELQHDQRKDSFIRTESSKAASSFSIIIPTFNRPVQLGKCLDCLTRLDFPKSRYEVVVVDDGSASGMETVVEPFRQLMNVSLITQRNSGPGIARNKGVANSRGRFIAFTDDDCQPARDWLATLSERLLDSPERMYGGHVSNALVDNIYSVASQLLVDYLYTYYNSETGRSQFYTSNNMAMARDIFDAVGGFDTNFPGACGEDRELCDRWRHCGYGMTYSPEAIVYHYHELNFPAFCRQHFGYGGGAVRFRNARVRRGQPRIRIEPPAFYLGLVGSAWKMKRSRPLSLTILMAISQIANAVGYVFTKFRL